MKKQKNIWTRARDVWKARSEPENLRRLADMYWYTLLVVAFGIVVGAVLYGSSMFVKVLQGGGEDEVTLVPGARGSTLFNTDAFDETIQGFSTRQDLYESLQENPPAIADPSR